jgi:hypothetical protein
MEILRFDEPDAPTPKRKRPSKAWLALSMVAALMGVGTAFASSTINLNKIDLGQGVTSVVACDNSIGVVPNTGLAFTEDKTPYFELKTLIIGSPNTPSEGTDFDGTVSDACAEKIFKVTLYHDGKSVGYDNGGKSLCDYFDDSLAMGHNAVLQAQQWKCVPNISTHIASIYFIAPASGSGSHTYTIDFHDYNLSNPDLYIDPSNITIETVSNSPF